MNILNKLGALRKKKTPREINGAEFNFYPVRVARILTGDLKDILGPVSDAIQILLQPRNQDEEVLEEVSPDGTIARATKPPTAEMVAYRTTQRQAIMKEAMASLFADDTRYKIARIIMDSLRDDCPANPNDEEIRQFADHDSMDIGTFSEFLRGFLSANSAIFGDLGNRIRERVAKVMKRMTEEPEEEAPEDDVPAQQQTDPTILQPLEEESQVPKT